MATQEQRRQSGTRNQIGHKSRFVPGQYWLGCTQIRTNALQTAKIGSLVDVNESEDPEGLRVFYYLVQDLKALVFSLISLHFKVSTTISKRPSTGIPDQVQDQAPTSQRRIASGLTTSICLLILRADQANLSGIGRGSVA